MTKPKWELENMCHDYCHSVSWHELGTTSALLFLYSIFLQLSNTADLKNDQ